MVFLATHHTSQHRERRTSSECPNKMSLFARSWFLLAHLAGRRSPFVSRARVAEMDVCLSNKHSVS